MGSAPALHAPSLAVLARGTQLGLLFVLWAGQREMKQKRGEGSTPTHHSFGDALLGLTAKDQGQVLG